MLPLDVWFALGGILGAFIRRFRAKDEGNEVKLYLADCLVAALGGPLLAAAANLMGFGDISALATNPWRAVALGSVPAYVGLDLLTMTSERWRGKPSTEAVKQIVEASKPTPAEAKAIAFTAAKASVEPPTP